MFHLAELPTSVHTADSLKSSTFEQTIKHPEKGLGLKQNLSARTAIISYQGYLPTHSSAKQSKDKMIIQKKDNMFSLTVLSMTPLLLSFVLQSTI